MKKVPKLKIDIRSQAEENTAIIDIDGEIGWLSYDGEEYTWNTPEAIKRKLNEIKDLKAEKIIVNINSLGGFVNDGLAIHDVLAMHDAHVETRVIGMTASAATIIAQAGDTRKMSENALYLIHRSWGFGMGNAHTIMELAEELEVIDKRMLSIYTKRSGKAEEEMLALMEENDGGGKWIDYEQAIEMGLVDESFEPMKAAASVNVKALKKSGYPIPDKLIHGGGSFDGILDQEQIFDLLDSEFKNDEESDGISQDDFLKELQSMLTSLEEMLSSKKEHETPNGESEEVASEGISRFEAQLTVNSNLQMR